MFLLLGWAVLLGAFAALQARWVFAALAGTWGGAWLELSNVWLADASTRAAWQQGSLFDITVWSMFFIGPHLVFAVLVFGLAVLTRRRLPPHATEPTATTWPLAAWLVAVLVHWPLWQLAIYEPLLQGRESIAFQSLYASAVVWLLLVLLAGALAGSLLRALWAGAMCGAVMGAWHAWLGLAHRPGHLKLDLQEAGWLDLTLWAAAILAHALAALASQGFARLVPWARGSGAQSSEPKRF
ncbi:MAG: hypothetical protein IT378_17325 [Sandaracinaceae bacterium]|nr:hypothetical protein [Sandaracinaceae bacterium]